MKKTILISAITGVAIAAGIAIKKINDSREVIDICENGTIHSEKETFKAAAIKKVNEILSWYAKNSEKIETVIDIVSGAATIVGFVETAIKLYSAINKKHSKKDDQILEELEEIRLRLLFLTPDVDIEHF